MTKTKWLLKEEIIQWEVENSEGTFCGIWKVNSVEFLCFVISCCSAIIFVGDVVEVEIERWSSSLISTKILLYEKNNILKINIKNKMKVY